MRLPLPYRLKVAFTLVCVIALGWPVGCGSRSSRGAAPADSAPATSGDEATAVRRADGAWKQVAAIESFNDYGGPYPVADVGPKPRSPNLNVFAFLDSARLLVADGRHPIRIVDPANGEQLHSFGTPLGPGALSREIVVSPDGRYILILPSSAPTIWDTRAGKAVGELPEAAKNTYYAAAFSAGGRLAALRSTELAHTMRNAVVTFAIDGDKGVAPLKECPADINARAVRAAGEYLCVTDADGGRVFKFDTLEAVFRIPPSLCYMLSFHAVNEATSLVALELGSAYAWRNHKPALIRYDIPEGKATPLDKFVFEEHEPNDHRFQAGFVASPDGETLAATREGHVDFYHLADGALFQTITLGNKLHHPQVQLLSSDRALLRTQTREGTMEYDLSKGEKLATIPDFDVAAVSPDGRRLALRRTCSTLGATGGYRDLAVPAVIVWERTK